MSEPTKFQIEYRGNSYGSKKRIKEPMLMVVAENGDSANAKIEAKSPGEVLFKDVPILGSFFGTRTLPDGYVYEGTFIRIGHKKALLIDSNDLSIDGKKEYFGSLVRFPRKTKVIPLNITYTIS
jgi:hypothetical protein